MNKDKHVIPGDDISTFAERVKREDRHENRSTSKIIYGSDNEPLSRVFVSNREIDDDGKLV
ncbi:MAG TPA: hypothetical protein VEG39_03110 [Clostridia bacterium]|nr:hypothetical protein [Clostridia bacterium]